jgi:hypothetical protein
MDSDAIVLRVFLSLYLSLLIVTIALVSAPHRSNDKLVGALKELINITDADKLMKSDTKEVQWNSMRQSKTRIRITLGPNMTMAVDNTFAMTSIQSSWLVQKFLHELGALVTSGQCHDSPKPTCARITQWAGIVANTCFDRDYNGDDSLSGLQMMQVFHLNCTEMDELYFVWLGAESVMYP